MREQLPNRDAVPARAGEVEEELPNRIVETEFALVEERHQGRDGDRLRDRTQQKEIIHRSGRPEGPGEHAASVPDVEDRRVHLFSATAWVNTSAATSSLSGCCTAAITEAAQAVPGPH